MNAAFNAMHNEARACIQLAEVENNLVLKAILMAWLTAGSSSMKNGRDTSRVMPKGEYHVRTTQA